MSYNLQKMQRFERLKWMVRSKGWIVFKVLQPTEDTEVWKVKVDGKGLERDLI